MQKIITLTTDFGFGEYVAAMKGAILKINSEATIIDISHAIFPQNVLEGAYVLYTTVPYFPYAVHIGVVDPGVGTKRKALIFECKNCIMVGPDNGLFAPCAKRMGLKKIYKIVNKDYFLNHVSGTFHGRDIFAPCAAHISKGVSISEIAEEIKGYVDMKVKFHEKRDNMLIGKVIHIDRFGNLITSLAEEIIMEYFDFGTTLEIELLEKRKRIKKYMKLLKSYGFVKGREFIATISSSGFFEVAANQENAAKLLKMGPYTEIRITI